MSSRRPASPRRFRAKSRAEWRSWLERHHATEPEIWLVYAKKHSGKPTVRYAEAVKEAICFGWIDTTVNRLELAAFPGVAITTLDGKKVTRADLAGKVVLVEFWATWCPPCRGTLGWLGEVKKRYGDRLTVLAIAVESQEPDVRKLTKSLDLPLTWAMGSPEVARAFGDISAVPTLFLFDRTGRTAGAFYGAPPELHDQAEAKVASLLGRSPAAR